MGWFCTASNHGLTDWIHFAGHAICHPEIHTRKLNIFCWRFIMFCIRRMVPAIDSRSPGRAAGRWCWGYSLTVNMDCHKPWQHVAQSFRTARLMVHSMLCGVLDLYAWEFLMLLWAFVLCLLVACSFSKRNPPITTQTSILPSLQLAVLRFCRLEIWPLTTWNKVFSYHWRCYQMLVIEPCMCESTLLQKHVW